jgi:lipopolysaccharide export LptBFGC system permease protein LptF
MFLGLFILFFIVDFLETTKGMEGENVTVKVIAQIVLYRIPNLLEAVLHFILLLSSLMAFYSLSNNSEITITI